MGKILLIALLHSCLVSSSISQTSIGIKNKNDLEPIFSYRLPKWGYTTLLFNTQGHAFNSKAEYSNNMNIKNNGYDFLISPAIKRYQESEKYLRHFNIGINFSTNYAFSKRDDNSNANLYRERKERKYDLSINFNSSWNQYIQDKTFILISGYGLAWYHSYENKDINEYESAYSSSETYKSIDKGYMINGKVGFGFGRVRNITPVIRAVRLRERFESIKDTSLISNSEIQLIAQDIAKVSGYKVVYDRDDKYFWDNLFDKVDGITLLSPFEIYFLTDILHENIGTRFEGWDVSTGLQVNRSNKINRALGWFGQGRRYKNLSLEKQISVYLNSSFQKYLDKKYDQKFEGRLGATLKYLWVLSDRILWESSINSILQIGQNQNESSDNLQWYKNQYHTLNSTFSYYIENSVELYCTSNFSLSERDRKYNRASYSGYSFNIAFGVNYFLNRKLF